MTEGIVFDERKHAIRFMTDAERTQWLATRHVGDQLVVIVAPSIPCPRDGEPIENVETMTTYQN